MRTLVVRLDSAGDVLLAGPAVRAAAASSSHVTLLCGPHGAAAARLLPGVDQVIVWDAPWVGLEPPPVRPAGIETIVETLAVEYLDRALILTSFHQSPLPTALVLRLAGIGWIGADSVDYPGSLLDLRHRRAPHRHEADAALDLAVDAGYALRADDPGGLAVLPPPDVRALVGDEPYVVVHPGAAVPARAPSPDTAIEITAALRERHRVLLTGGPDETALTAAIARRTGAEDLGGRTGLHGLAGILAGAGVAVVGNTGPAHLAAAVGTPVVSLFAPVVPAERWAPYGVPSVLLGDQHAPCADTRARTCPVPGHPCLSSIRGADVRAAVDSLLRRVKQRPTVPLTNREVIA
ncbi:glycosyltransferase family 9 protein [Cryptosporangium arvum]|uniref:ADP-heptose:LPS heptosyltransferase n=1 Tax=Cryptosporangium arvum DSM 44712 TaxID=927661 RepID=A0A010ZSP6_9ACTN|nr:glycosyltransferase family 9 protein [Cryptosporangium arvum]EXG81719.1 ADP-heptose:LPS heptosyltransferase [Cryptosporangium arvum DSM 44712]